MYTFWLFTFNIVFLSTTMDEMNVSEVINYFYFQFCVMFNTKCNYPPQRQTVSLKALWLAANVCS
jgi:hypothetical protein